MLTSSSSLQNFAVGIFPDLCSADRGAAALLTAGFSKDQITALCADEVHQSHLRQLAQAHPGEAEVAHGATTGASVGAAVGGLAAIALGAVTGAVPLILAGAAGISGGSAIGGFVGAIMETEGKGELARYFDQEIRSGKILIAVEEQGPQAAIHLQNATRILLDAGAKLAPDHASPPTPFAGKPRATSR
jgi:hypothetical protein